MTGIRSITMTTPSQGLTDSANQKTVNWSNIVTPLKYFHNSSIVKIDYVYYDLKTKPCMDIYTPWGSRGGASAPLGGSGPQYPLLIVKSDKKRQKRSEN